MPGLIPWMNGYVAGLEEVIHLIDEHRAVASDEQLNLALFRVQDQIRGRWEIAQETLRLMTPGSDHEQRTPPGTPGREDPSRVPE